jgi:hypothetical protein
MAPIGPWGSGFAADYFAVQRRRYQSAHLYRFLPSSLLDSKVRKRDQPNRAQAKGAPDAGRLLFVQSWRQRRRGLELQPQCALKHTGSLITPVGNHRARNDAELIGRGSQVHVVFETRILKVRMVQGIECIDAELQVDVFPSSRDREGLAESKI